MQKAKIILGLLLVSLACSSTMNMEYHSIASQQQCDDPVLFKSLAEQASIFFGDDIGLQINYIQSKLPRTKYLYWYVLVTKNQKQFTSFDVADGWISSCYYKCLSCNIYQPSLNYKIVGYDVSNYKYKFDGLLSFNSKRSFHGQNLTDTDLLVWRNIIKASEIYKTYREKAYFITCQIEKWRSCQVISVFVFDRQTEVFGSYPSGTSSYGLCTKFNSELVEKQDDLTVIVIPA